MSSVAPLCLSEDTIAAFVGSTLDGAASAHVEHHLEQCPDCLLLVTAAAAGAGSNVARLDSKQGASARFERRQMIARGGMGVVYEGYDRVTGTLVAIKQLRSGSALAESAVLERFMREAAILRRLDHPNIVKLVASVSDDPWQIVMEYVHGGSLRARLLSDGRWPWQRSVALVLELADALARAHHLAVIHRDIKPENVLLTADGTPKLADFGLAMFMDSGLSASNAMLGTIGYLSPEALSGQPLDARTDLWALGVMLFEMLAGHRPFEGETPSALAAAILHQPAPDLTEDCPDVPPELAAVVAGLLQKDRGARFGSAREVGARLESLTLAAVQRARLDEARAEAQPTSSAALAIVELPAQTTPFVGREAELAELCTLLSSPEVRVLSIVGPGGMGKSRLALEVARTLGSAATRGGNTGIGRGLSGVYFVDLAPLHGPDLIIPAVAEAVGFQFHPGADPKRQLCDYFREKHVLLLMDNFEHVIAGAGFVSELVRSAPGVRVLATSRERLGLHAETQFVLAGMNVPSNAALSRALDFSAVALFVGSARRVSSTFTLGDDDAAEVVNICQLVQGMPLGIVLAAAWVDTLSIPEIAFEIGKSIDFLRSDAGDLPSRQQSIRAIFDHSWALLGNEERRVFAAVSLFRGGFTRAAAEAVTGAAPRTLAALVAKSLLRRVPETGRYELHELLRQYAEAHLQSAPSEHDAAMGRLAAFFSEFAASLGTEVLGPRRGIAMQAIEAELDNIHVALRWMLEHQQAERVWPVLHPLGLFYHCRRSRPEGELAFDTVARAFGGAGVGAARAVRKALGLALLYQALFCEEQGRKPDALGLVERAVVILGEVEHDVDYGLALTLAAWMGVGVGEPQQLLSRVEEGIALCRAEGGWWLVRALTVSCRVYVGVARDLERAEASMNECVSLQRSLARGSIAYPDSLALLGFVRCSQGHRQAGCSLILDSLALAERIDDARTMSLVLHLAAATHRDLGDYKAAEAFARRCIAHARELGEFETVARCHFTLASILREQRRPADAIAEYHAGAAASSGNRALVARAELGLGKLALELRDYAAAERHLVSSMAICEADHLVGGARHALEALGWLACEQGRHHRAHHYFRRAFRLARRQELPGVLLGLVAAVATLFARRGQVARSAQLASLALHHPATSHRLRTRRIDPLLEQLADRLSPSELQAALALGERSTLTRALEESLVS